MNTPTNLVLVLKPKCGIIFVVHLPCFIATKTRCVDMTIKLSPCCCTSIPKAKGSYLNLCAMYMYIY